MSKSAFDAYCRIGFGSRSPHWLFQEIAYRQRYPDLRDGALERAGSANGYDHFLRHGSREGRIGHILFDPLVYRTGLTQRECADADAMGGYQHYLRNIRNARTRVRRRRAISILCGTGIGIRP